MSSNNIIVLKFGSSVLQREADLSNAVHEIYRSLREGYRVVAVVSAIGDTTDELVDRGKAWVKEPPPAAWASLLATGETTACALLALALDRAGTPSTLLDAALAGLLTSGPLTDASPESLDVDAILEALDEAPVVVLPGFTGRDDSGRTTLLGRGGSDLTALFVAHRLGARCLLLKDVDGIYDCDPERHPGALRYAQVSWDEALEIGGAIVQPKAVRFAAERAQSFEVGCIGSETCTLVNGGPNVSAAPARTRRLRVALLGCGTVGAGVFRALSRSDAFEVVGIAVKRAEIPRDVPTHLVSGDPGEVIRRPCDVVVELIGGTDPASGLIAEALELGRHVVTANKAVIARDGELLRGISSRTGSRLLYSASVGGALPAIELVRSLQGIVGIEGVLNGTCNYVLDRISAGRDLRSAVIEAQEAGYAEADPSGDLSGRDTAHKIAVLAREAFGVSPQPFQFQGLTDSAELEVAEAAENGQIIRLVASCYTTPTGVTARVETRRCGPESPFAQTEGVDNCVVVHTGSGDQIARGKGAGRWPTTEAVVADLLDLHRTRADVVGRV